uniref:Uncharacterized protein n=1 Tax=Panagrolaimus sp. ES5 TaxID=591445 RepID=A0AC34G8H6_9BILA
MDPDTNGFTLPYIPTTPPTTTPTSSCIPPPNAAGLFIETGVVIDPGTFVKQADPIGTCKNSPNGMTAYYNGATPNQYSLDDAVWVGEWIRTGCLLPCVCTTSTCYVPLPALVFGSGGAIVNPMNPLDMFSINDQSGDDVNDPGFPKVESIGCSGCPVMP